MSPICMHGVDLETARCCQCDDPAFHAAQQPPANVKTLTVGGGSLASKQQLIEAAFLKYGRHTHDCQRYGPHQCNCGFVETCIAIGSAGETSREYPRTIEPTLPNSQGWCQRCGCGKNDPDGSAVFAHLPTCPTLKLDGCHGLDNARQVFFYEQDFYVLSNFSAFMIQCNGLVFPTSEHAYHWDKFPNDPLKQRAIQVSSSAHDAFKMAERWKQYRRPDWDEVKVGIMSGILRLKAEQHEYVARKLEASGDRELIENSWRDDFWGWGPNRDGQNMLGKLWMEVRAERRAVKTPDVGFDANGSPV